MGVNLMDPVYFNWVPFFVHLDGPIVGLVIMCRMEEKKKNNSGETVVQP